MMKNVVRFREESVVVEGEKTNGGGAAEVGKYLFIITSTTLHISMKLQKRDANEKEKEATTSTEESKVEDVNSRKTGDSQRDALQGYSFKHFPRKAFSMFNSGGSSFRFLVLLKLCLCKYPILRDSQSVIPERYYLQ